MRVFLTLRQDDKIYCNTQIELWQCLARKVNLAVLHFEKWYLVHSSLHPSRGLTRPLVLETRIKERKTKPAKPFLRIQQWGIYYSRALCWLRVLDLACKLHPCFTVNWQHRMNHQTTIPREIMLAHDMYLTFVCERYSSGCGDSNASLITAVSSGSHNCVEE